MGIKLGLSHQGRSINWGCLRTGCGGEYFELRGRKWQEAGIDSILRCFMTCRMRWGGHVARTGEKCVRYFGWKT
jgi:hypothetical protein